MSDGRRRSRSVMKELTIGKNDADQRLDKFISKAFPAMPQSMLYRAVRTRHIKLNGKRCAPSDRLAEGDTVTVFLTDDVLAKRERALADLPPVEVVYQDENVMLVNKPAGLSVHDDESGDADTLIARVLKMLADAGEYSPEAENSFVPALCNRIDRNTCGIVIVAKNAEALRIMNKMIAGRRVHKRYLCLVHGVPEPKSATLKAFIRKDEKEKRSFVTDEPAKGALTMITKYETLKTDGAVSLLSVDLVTGRTHQIRAHMAHIGHPLVGDGKYGGNDLYRKSGRKYQALCAASVTFDFGGEGEALDYLDGKTFSVTEPDFVRDFKQR